MAISSGTLTNWLKRVTGLYLPDGCSSSSVEVSPKVEAQASNSCRPRSDNAAGSIIRCTENISPSVLVIGVPEASTSALPGFFVSMKRDLTNRSQARCEPFGSTPRNVDMLVAKDSLRNSCASSTMIWSMPSSEIVSRSSLRVASAQAVPCDPPSCARCACAIAGRHARP
jgi:hypothetical protein